MIGAFVALLGCQLIGEVLVRLAGLPFPGPVLGMLLLFVFLMFRPEIPRPLRVTSYTLLDHLSLLFVPAGTGIMLHFGRIRTEWLPILAALSGQHDPHHHGDRRRIPPARAGARRRKKRNVTRCAPFPTSGSISAPARSSG